ncbi:MAG: hypothetical protein M3R12_11430 [Actinomycetota bacterium]|nr:hypothetical protein [Actinomycetota bacterium]
MSLRGNPVAESATLPDGRIVRIDVRILEDPYIEERSETVTVELHADDGEVRASVATVLEPEQTSEARGLAREIRAGLESGELEPTAGAIEPLGDVPR